MPVIHRYQDGFGLYIRGKLDGGYITYQVSPVARRLLEAEGYTNESKISWALCQRLSEAGEIYTHGTGQSLGELGGSNDNLSGAERRVATEIDDTEDVSQKPIPEDIQQIVSKWTESPVKRLFSTVTDHEACYATIQHFDDICTPGNFRLPAGKPTFLFEQPVHWSIATLTTTPEKAEYQIRITNEGMPSQTLLFNGGKLTAWKLLRDTARKEDVDLLIEALPAIHDLLQRIRGKPPDVGQWQFTGRRGVTLERDDRKRLETVLRSLATKSGLSEGPTTGVVASKEYAGYGKIKLDSRDKLVPFSPRHAKAKRLKEGEEVEFVLKLVKTGYRAVDVDRVN